jgi:hypothetical protein
MGITLIVLDPSGSVLTLPTSTLEQSPDASLVQKAQHSFIVSGISLLMYLNM